MRFILLLFALTIIGFGQATHASTIVVSGDANMLVGADPTSPNLNADNQTFLKNVLGAGTTVFISNETLVGGPSTDAFYNSLPGVTSTFAFGDTQITSSLLSGVDLYVQLGAANDFLASEQRAIANFLNDGGTLFSVGDYNNVSRDNGFQNTLLSNLGSSIQIDGNILDFFYRTTDNIATDPLTAGVTTLTYAAPGFVSGGTSLVQARDGADYIQGTFIAYETGVVANVPPVPLPAPAFLLLGGLAGLAALRRKQRG